MPKWIHNRADHIRKKNPGMPESESFAIATQQAYASKKAPKDYGTDKGRTDANKKYDKSPSSYEQNSDPKEKTSMKEKLAGHLPLAEMISQQITAARHKMKVASAGSAEEKEVEETTEKVASSIDFTNPDDIEKLASALDSVAEKLAGDKVDNGGEKPQGGQKLPVMSAVGGRQSYKKDSAPKHAVPNSTGMDSASDGSSGNKTMVPTDEKKGPYLHQPYPKKGVLKTAAQSVMDKIRTKVTDKKEDKPEPETEKKSEAVQFILGKIAATSASGESRQGGMTLDSKSGEGVKPPTGGSNSARGALESSSAATNLKKRDAKKIQVPQLSQVLTEPALSKAKDNKVQENLRNADKGGVKIAAARAYLQKIAAGGCTCEGDGSCKYCVLKSKMSKA
jgi:hypothetical protein